MIAVSETRYISDWHYGHSNIIGYDNRPFIDVEDMNRSLIAKWNDVVSKKDTVYILGDMFWVNAETASCVLDKLNGEKILIRGNHDQLNFKVRNKFSTVKDYLEIKDGDKNVVLCHYPIPFFKNNLRGWIHLYGHVHSSYEHNIVLNTKFQLQNLYCQKVSMYNVGAMMPYINYAPRTLKEIMEGVENV